MSFILPLIAGAQPQIEDTTEYTSSYDDSITLENVTYLPTTDNVNGVYSKAIDKKLRHLVSKNHKWNYIEPKTSSSQVNPEELINAPEKVRSFAEALSTDGFFVAKLRKDPNRTRIHLYLFSTLSGALITEEELSRPDDNTEIVLAAVQSLFNRILEKIPYDAMIASRTDNRVTINAGRNDGVTVGQTLTAVKVIGAKTHPKRKFIIKSHKAILGQLRVVKVDPYLSFADIVSEAEPGVLDKNTKITGISRVQYESTPWTNQYTPAEQLLSENNKSVFGKEAREWIAKDPPTFGRVGADIALGSFDNNLALSDGSNANAKVNVYPRINLSGELWITPKVYTNMAFAQGIGQSANPTGNPSEVSNSLTQYRLSFGYNFILRNEFFGPKLSIDLGFNSYQMFVDSSGPSGFTTLQYRSLPLGIGGHVPINSSRTWAIGGKAYFHLFPSLRETPFSSGGDPDNNINHFLFYAENKLSQRLRLKVGLEFLLLSTSFGTGGGRPVRADNLSHRFTMLTTGIDYLF
jgi:hypothetical protein